MQNHCLHQDLEGKGEKRTRRGLGDREVGAEEEPVENSVERTRKESARKADAVSGCRDTGTERPRQLVGRRRTEEKVDLRHQLGVSGKAGNAGAISDISLVQLGEAGAGFWILFSRLFVHPRPRVRAGPGAGVSECAVSLRL